MDMESGIGIMPRTIKSKQQLTAISEDQTTARILLKGPMPQLNKMKTAELKAECEMWRNIWNWVPSEVRYYIARTGQTIGLTMRNYKRYLGTLLDTHWNLEEVEVGVMDKIYDIVDGKHYFERKIVKVKVGSIIDVQWIAERHPEDEATEPTEAELLEAEGRDKTVAAEKDNTVTP